VPKKGHIPERTCIVCRKKTFKTNLIRFCIENEKLVIDYEQKKGGRGAYSCLSCLPKIKKSKILKKLLKALRTENIKNIDEITNLVKEGLNKYKEKTSHE